MATTNGSVTRRFVYDADGRVMGEYGTSATDVKAEFLWALPEVANDNTPFGGDDGADGYMPLAVATPNGAGTVVLNWVHGSHLGVPLVTTDSAGNAATTPNDYLAPGFPGQSRTLADLYYNRYRDYDPTTGRYIQADPIGLAGGQNAYAYAGNNPMRWIDPMGLLPNSPFCAISPLACITMPLIDLMLPTPPKNNVCPVPIGVSKPAIADVNPKDFCEQLALAEAKAGAGEPRMGEMADEPRLIAHYGPGPWRKMQHTHTCPSGRKLVIHYFTNGRGLNVELKFV